MTAIYANDTGLPDGCEDRLTQFALEQRVETFPSDQVLIGEGDGRTFSDGFLRYCAATGLSIDWLYYGEGHPLADLEASA